MNFYSLSGSATVEKQSVIAVILAAGYGKRMKSDLPKVAHEILGMPLIYWPLYSLGLAGVQKIVVVLSPQQHQVEALVKKLKSENSFFQNIQIEIAFQTEAQGTGDAAKSALSAVNLLSENKPTTVMVCLGDIPAVTPKSYISYLNAHKSQCNDVTVLGFEPEDAKTYGRVLTSAQQKFLEIREFKDCTKEQQKTTLCNSGFLCSTLNAFEKYLPLIKNNNAAREFYLTDLPTLALANGDNVGLHILEQPSELEGVNSQAQLAGVAKIIQQQIVQHWLDNGVQILNPEQVYIDPWVSFDNGVIIEPFVYLAGRQHFSKGTRILAGSRFVK